MAASSPPDGAACSPGVEVAALSNKPLQRTRACQLSVEGQRAGTARLMK